MYNYKKNLKITSLDGFYEVICKYPIICWRDKIHNCSEFFSWKIKDLKQSIDEGFFYTVIEKEENE